MVELACDRYQRQRMGQAARAQVEPLSWTRPWTSTCRRTTRSSEPASVQVEAQEAPLEVAVVEDVALLRAQPDLPREGRLAVKMYAV